MYPPIEFGIMCPGIGTRGYKLVDRPNLEDRGIGGSMGLDLLALDLVSTDPRPSSEFVVHE